MPLSDPTYFYLTADEYVGTGEGEEAVAGLTQVPTLVTPLSSEAVTALLLETMAQIDAYCGGGWTPFEDDQEFIFPRCQDTDSDGNALIPRSVALATRMIADAILSKRAEGVLPHEVASEANLGHSVTRKATQQVEQGFEHFPPAVFGLLQKYRKFGGMMALDDPTLMEC